MNVRPTILMMAICLLTWQITAQNSVAFIPNRLIVKFKTSSGATLQSREKTPYLSFGIADVDKLNKEWGCRKAELIEGGGVLRSIVLEFDKPIDVKKAIEAYYQTGKFEFVEPDYVASGGGYENCPPELTPNDTYFLRQWGMRNDGTFSLSTAVAGNDIKAVDAWNVTTGSASLVTCIVDSGCKLDHPDLAGRIWQNTKEIAGNGIDDDKNGRIDDTRGWDFINNDNDPTDDHGHGTNVTGILGLTGNNNQGYAGMDWKCQLMILKSLNNNNSGSYSAMQSAIYYAVDNGANVINMSIVGVSFSSALEAAVNYAWDNGVLLFACSGNDNVGEARYPAAFDKAFAVASVNPDGKRSRPFFWNTNSGSNYGSYVDACAPGNYIYGINFSSNTNYGTYWGGTSQATPLAAGLASLMLAKNKNLTPAQIKRLIEQGCDDRTGDPSEDIVGFDNYHGWGRINAKKTLDLVPLNTNINEPDDVSAFFEVYPNPTKGVFTLSTKNLNINTSSSSMSQNSENTIIQIFDFSGKLIYQKTIPSTLSQDWFLNIDLSLKPEGIYMVYLKNDNYFGIKKIIHNKSF